MKILFKVLILSAAVAGCSTPSYEEGKPVQEMTSSLMESSTGRVKNIERPFIVDSGHMKVVGEHFKIKEQPVLPKVFDRHFA